MTASISEASPGLLQLRGALDYRSGPELRVAGQQLIRDSAAARLVLDCSAVEKSSSVGLSLLLCFLRDARESGKALVFRALPAEMQQLAGVSGLDELLPQEN